MLCNERKKTILNMLNRHHQVNVNDLAKICHASQTTIRNDLNTLARDGYLQRVHGGAIEIAEAILPSVQSKRINVNSVAKTAIAQTAQEFIHDGESILIDTGTTGLELARALGQKRDLTIITADITIADFIDKSLPSVEVILLGGFLRKSHRYTTGPASLESLKLLRPDIAFVCPTAYSSGRGFMTNYEPSAELKKAYLHSAQQTIILMDSEKVGKNGLFFFGDLTDTDLIIMDKDPGNIVTSNLGNQRNNLVLAKSN